MKKIIYPRYTREQNARCKLSDNDIVMIRFHKWNGVSTKALSEKYGVTITTIRGWFSSDEERREKNRKAYLKYGDRYGVATRKKRADKSNKKKDRMMPGKRNEYYKLKGRFNRSKINKKKK